MPSVKLLSAGVNVGTSLLIEVVTDLAVVVGVENEAHKLTGNTVYKIILSVFALLNDLLKFVLNSSVSSDSHLNGVFVCDPEKFGVEVGSHADNVICGTAVKEAVNAVKHGVLLFDLLNNFLVLRDLNGNRLCLDLVTSTSGTCRAVVLYLSVYKTLCFHRAGSRVAGEICVLHVRRNEGFHNALNNLAVGFGQIFLTSSVLSKDSQRFNSCHSELLLIDFEF